MNSTDRSKALTPRDEQHASQYPLVRDRSTIGVCHTDDASMRVVVEVLDFIGDELGRMVKTTEVAYGVKMGDYRLGQSTALSALSVLSSWGFVANLGEVNGRYVYARTAKSPRLLGMERHQTYLRVIQARDRKAREAAAEVVAA